MSAGHGDVDTRGLSAVVINRLMDDQEIKQRLLLPHVINQEYDLPYLGGYSKDGKTIYIDRHFPASVTLEEDGHKCTFNATQHICDHERFEKAVMDVLGWSYQHAHEAANGFERRGVLQAGLPWQKYNNALLPFIKADEHEKLVRVPPDLDMKPYYAPPVDKRLVAHMESVMGGSKKSKNEVGYEPVASMPKTKCGNCEYFIKPNSCTLVRGYISDKAWCELYEKESENGDAS